MMRNCNLMKILDASGNFVKVLKMFLIYGMSPATPPGKMKREKIPYGGQIVELDLYEPDRCIYGTWLLITGLTLPGEKDKRITGLAEAMRRCGIRVAALSLPGLKSLNIDTADINAIKGSIDFLFRKYSKPVGIHGYCIGGGYALAAAADPFFDGMIDTFVLVGPHYDVSQACDNLYDVYKGNPENERELDGFLWLNLLLAYRHMNRIDLSAADRAELEYLMWTYCEDKSLERKRKFYEKCLKGTDFTGIEDIIPDKEISQELSPAGKMKNLASKVFIIHDKNDIEVSPGQAEKLFKELCERGSGSVQKMHVSSILTHTEIMNMAKPSDAFRTIMIFSELFSLKEAL